MHNELKIKKNKKKGIDELITINRFLIDLIEL
jgi:hypothetical protein